MSFWLASDWGSDSLRKAHPCELLSVSLGALLGKWEKAFLYRRFGIDATRIERNSRTAACL